MFSAPWICRRCLNASLKSNRKRLSRYASNVPIKASIGPALLARARSMALEHDKLSEETSDSFDIKIAKRIGELKSVSEALREWEDIQASVAELDNLLKDPTTDAELRELAAEDLEATSVELDTTSRKLTVSLTPKHPFADMPCFIEIRPGAGGGEAAIFAGDLLRMYQAYCTRKGLRASLIKYETASLASDSASSPLEEAILEVETPGSYGELRSEAGVHRVQRVPATEKTGRTHTSAASVLVLPSLPATGSEGLSISEVDLNDPTSDYYVNPTEVRVDVMRARGAGGQHVNTTDSAVRLTHIPTGMVVAMQDSRSQHKNRAAAWSMLRSRMAQAKIEAREEQVRDLRRGVMGVAKMGRGDKIRTYNYGQQRVTDHRSGLNVHNLDNVMEGGDELDKIVESVKEWLGEREIEGLLAEDQMATKKSKSK